MSEGIFEGQLEYTCEEAAEYTGFWSIEVSDDFEPETGLCVYCLNYDTDLVEVQGVYGVGKCCSEEAQA